VLRRFQGTLKSLTDASKAASEQLLNQDFEKRFREECEALKAPAVTLEFPGRRGEPARRKSLTPRHRLSAILSEGEQKVIALADFLAEVSLRRSASPVVLDDPVTSLDYKRLSYVVGRIVDLSAERQVIVFTHNIIENKIDAVIRYDLAATVPVIEEPAATQ
jgi:recombinational DNA repair ATPase RecF